MSKSKRIAPIASLNPFENRSVIRGRVTCKSAIKTWARAESSGKLFSFEVLDGSGEILVNAFQEQCDRFYDVINVNKVYYITGFQCKFADKRWNTIGNEYELFLDKTATIELCDEPHDDIPKRIHSFVSISDIETLPIHRIFDVCGVLKGVSEPQIVNRKSDGKSLTKRDAYLVDESKKIVVLTIWNSALNEIDRTDHPVVLISKARISMFNGCLSIATGARSSVEINPDIDRARELKTWWQNGGEGEDSEPLGSSDEIEGFEKYEAFDIMVKRCELFHHKPLHVWNWATIVWFDRYNCLYKACPTVDCSKKVKEQGDGNYFCEKCATSGLNYKWRFVLKMLIADATGELECTAFNEAAGKILGVDAATLGSYSENNLIGMDEVFASAMFKRFHFKFRNRMEVFQDARRYAHVVTDVKELEPVGDCRRLEKSISGLAKFL